MCNRNPDGSPHFILGIAHDFTHRKAMEEALHESRAYNRKLFELSPIGLVLHRLDGTIIEANEAYASILGRTVEETLGLTYGDVTPEWPGQRNGLSPEAVYPGCSHPQGP